MTKFDLQFIDKKSNIVTRIDFDKVNNATAFAEKMLGYAGKLNFIKMFDGAVMRAENNDYKVYLVRS